MFFYFALFPGGQCTPKDRLQCRAVQKWLQLTSLFQGCHCNVSRTERQECLKLRKTIYVDYCNRLGPSKGENIFCFI